jgi:hypothetical protein
LDTHLPNTTPGIAMHNAVNVVHALLVAVTSRASAQHVTSGRSAAGTPFRTREHAATGNRTSIHSFALRHFAVKNTIATLIALSSLLAGCTQSGSTDPGPLPVYNKRIDTFSLRLEPIGDYSNSTFNQYNAGNASGFASIFLKQSLETMAAKDQFRAIDFVYVLGPLNGVSSNGNIRFLNPAAFNQNYNPMVNLGWPSYSDGPQFVRLLRSKRIDPVTSAYLALSEAEFDNVTSPDQITDIVTHSLSNGSEKRSTYNADYFGGKSDGMQLLGLFDSKGFSCLIKILPGVNVFGLNITVKRGYSTN